MVECEIKYDHGFEKRFSYHLFPIDFLNTLVLVRHEMIFYHTKYLNSVFDFLITSMIYNLFTKLVL
jgi:hypothetical protein